MEIILTIILILFIFLFIYHMRKSKKKKPVIDESCFVEVKNFDNDDYVKTHFDSIFYSIQIEGWKMYITYDKIQYSKLNGTRQILISFEYKFISNTINGDRVFDIENIKLSDGTYTIYKYKDRLPIEVKKFLYENYFDWISDNNSKAKAKADESLKNIREVVGKSYERGSKLDKLLGD